MRPLAGGILTPVRSVAGCRHNLGHARERRQSSRGTGGVTVRDRHRFRHDRERPEPRARSRTVPPPSGFPCTRASTDSRARPRHGGVSYSRRFARQRTGPRPRTDRAPPCTNCRVGGVTSPRSPAAGGTAASGRASWCTRVGGSRGPKTSRSSIGIPTVTPELLLLQLAGWKPSPKYVEALIHAARRKRLISYDSAHATFVRHAAGVDCGACGCCARNWNGGIRAGRPTESEMETLLVQGLRAARHPRARPAVRGLRRAWDLRRVGPMPVSHSGGSPSSTSRCRSTSTSSNVARDDRRRNQIMAAGYFPLSARVQDVRSGAWDLADEIRAIARRTA